MAYSNPTNDDHTGHAAGALDGLNLGAPIGGASTGGALPARGSTTTTTGLGSSTHSHSHGQTGDYTTGQTGDRVTGSQYGSNTAADQYNSATGGIGSREGAINSTSGDKGVGYGRGGPSAFEADESKVGENHHHHDHSHGHNHGSTGAGFVGTGAPFSSSSGVSSGNTGSHDKHSHHHDGGINNTGSRNTTTDLLEKDAAIKAGLGAGHHDQRENNIGSNTQNYSSGSTGHSSSGLTGSSGLQGVRGEGERVADSVTGQTHFRETGPTYNVNATTLGAGAGAGALGAGAAYESGRSHNDHSSSSSGGGLKEKLGLSGQPGGGSGPGAELQRELDEHKKSGSHASHPESEGPHGLVFDEATGKYVHRRELTHKGSTGVPLA